MSSLQNYTIPNSRSIKIFREKDFALDTKDKICIYDEKCNIVFFYTESPDSKRILEVFLSVAESIVGPNFGTCNVNLERGVSSAFEEISINKDHPLHWVAIRKYPFMLIYRGFYPVNFYDGPANPTIMANFCLNVANNNNFHIRNENITTRIKSEMWSEEYKIRGIKPHSKNPRSRDVSESSIDIPALPYTVKKDIE
jgi:hypothetical protein